MSPSSKEDATQYFFALYYEVGKHKQHCTTLSCTAVHCELKQYGQKIVGKKVFLPVADLLKFHSACRPLFNAMEMFIAMLLEIEN